MKNALDAGADGGLLKDIAGMALSAALRRILRGEQVVDPRIVSDESRRSTALSRLGLTRREYEVLRLAAEGKTNPEIALSIDLTRNTIKTYLQSALHKLGARNRVEAIARAGEAGLL
jgi:DNA-binding NarL/FixJ family response regulator